MNIGEVAEKSGMSAKMIRKYEASGITAQAKRNSSGYRIYSSKDIHTFRFIKKSRSLGFSMIDIKELVSLWINKRRSSSKVKKITEKHIERLEKKNEEITNILKTLKHLNANCHGDNRPDCPIIDSLGEK